MEDKKYQNCPICGTPCEVIQEGSEGATPVEEIWESFWKPIVSNEDGTINIEQVKKELADFSFVMEQVPKVYCHITGDMMSKVMYRADDVIRMADDHFNEQLKEALKDELEESGVNETELQAASQPPAVKGAVWVKAVDYRPVKETEYRPYRKVTYDDEFEYDYGEIYVTTDDGKIFYDIRGEKKFDVSTNDRWADFDILSESTTDAGNGNARKIIENILFSTGKFREEHCSALAIVILEDIAKLQTAGDGKEAKDLLDWIKENDLIRLEDGTWAKWDNGEAIYRHFVYGNDPLFEKYLTDKNK